MTAFYIKPLHEGSNVDLKWIVRSLHAKNAYKRH